MFRSGITFNSKFDFPQEIQCISSEICLFDNINHSKIFYCFNERDKHKLQINQIIRSQDAIISVKLIKILDIKKMV